MSKRLFVTCILAIGALFLSPARSQDGELSVLAGDEFVLTLRALDDLTCAVDFEAGGYGAFLAGAQVSLERAELAYSVFAEGLMSFGFRDREQAKIVDLGRFFVPAVPSPRDLAPHPPASILHTLVLDNRQVAYTAPPNKRLTLREAAPALGILPEPGMQHLRPEPGHVYLLRYRGVPEAPDSWGRIVAFQVIELVPGQRLTLRGKILPGSP